VILKSAGDVTAEWLTEVLDEPVALFTTEPVGTGQMGDAFRIRTGSGTTAILKVAAADETSRATGLALRIFEVEVRFYQQLARALRVPVPHCFAADVEVETGWFTLLLEDMAPAVQGDQIAGCDLPQVEIALRALAALHASGWENQEIAALPWLNRTTPESITFTAGLIQGLFPGFLERYDDSLTDRQREICTALMDALPGYLGDRSGPMTVVHGDYRLDNLLFEGDRVTVVDWQTATWGPPMVDTSYFLACAIADPDVRAGNEERLIGLYHRELGRPDYSWDQCWRDYRRMAFGTLVMAIASSMLVQRTERGDRMFLCSVERACAQVDHLNSLELLP
jgi:aminoglycoside/choline kinase family phosphotransferase